jgi:2-methylcitrate dehydratase PrpD
MAIVTKGIRPASELVTGKAPEWLSIWAEFASKTGFENLPPAVVDRTCLVILDSIGAILAGRAETEIAAAEERLGETARVDPRGSPLITAFLDGTAGTMLEIDEGNQYARGHPGIHVVPAVLAAGAASGADGKSAIAAIVLGYEIGGRIGAASKLKAAMHPHGTWGTAGAAVAIAKLHGASAAAFASVINVSSSLALATSRRTMLEGGTVRNTYAGFSNMIGMMSWDLVAAGFTGESDGIGSVYDGIVADGFDVAAMTQELGQRWEIARNYFKRHAACRYNHGALDALAEIVARNGDRLEPGSIEAIEVQTYVWAAQLDHPAPDNMLAAKFSMPFSLATFLVNGAAGLDAFRDEARAGARTRALAQKIRVDEDPAMTARLPRERPARVRVHLKDGRTLEAAVTTNKGDTEDPYSRDEVVEKFYEVTASAIETSRAREIAGIVLALPAEADLTRLHALLGRQQ